MGSNQRNDWHVTNRHIATLVQLRDFDNGDLSIVNLSELTIEDVEGGELVSFRGEPPAVDEEEPGEGVVVRAERFQEAAEQLDDGAGRPVHTLVLMLRSGRGEGDSLRLGFSRFVTALRRTTRVVRRIMFLEVDWRDTPEGETAELLGEVLPVHPTIKSITFSFCDFSLPHLQLFTSSVPTQATRPAKLEFRDRPMDRDSAQAIADMVRRNVPISSLSVGLFGGFGVDADGCQLICRSVPSNKNLRWLGIQVKGLYSDTLENVASSSSSLQGLTVIVHDPMSEDGVGGLARQLRTNTTMKRLILLQYIESHPAELPDCFRPIEEVLETYNVTLTTVVVNVVDAAGLRTVGPPSAVQTRIRRILRRNRQIQRALYLFLIPDYRGTRTVRQLPITSRVLELAANHPTLMYRALRHGEASDLCDLVYRDKGPKKRDRAPSSHEEGASPGQERSHQPGSRRG
jgi:hypothetical protein